MSLFDYPKFLNPRTKVLLFNEKDYFLDRELAQIDTLGVTVVQFHYFQGKELLPKLLEFIYVNKPDFLLSINLRGFDPEGALHKALKQINLPIVVWFLDNPFYILRGASSSMGDLDRVFLWDSSYVEPFSKRYDVESHFLPLGASPYFDKRGSFDLEGPVSFVGSSMNDRILKIEAQFPDINFKALKLNLSSVLKSNRGHSFDVFLRSFIEQEGLASDKIDDLNEYIRYYVTQKMRISLIHQFEALSLYGDEAWSLFINENIYSPLNYYTELPIHFGQNGVHLNLTHYQMPKGVNQRVFDVLSAGGCLLTDQQEDLIQLFPGWKEWSYQEVSQIPELLVKMKSSNDYSVFLEETRQEIQRKHKYSDRMKNLVENVKPPTSA